VLEVAGHPFGLGVQWHPEELVIEHETARKVFGAFIEASRNGCEAGR
jgi:putative glutamine amidotransferase